MIYIVTGLPGAAKTLYSINRVLTDPQLTGPGDAPRPVYYSGIDDLQLPWYKCEPRDWPTLPDGSVIVIDEAWKVFPLRPTGSIVPPHVQALAEHRHHGLDFVLITQDASLVDAFVRKLTERHFHLKRPFGLDYAVVHEFHEVQDHNSTAALKQALQSRFKHPKHLYSVYKSATIHAVKKRVPMKILVLPLALAAVGYFCYSAYSRIYNSPDEKVLAAKSSGKYSALGAPGQNQVAAPAGALPKLLPEYLDHFTPRTPMLPQSAPVFDKLVSDVKDFPRMSACVKTKSRCWCYTQQGSRIDARPDVCQAFTLYAQFDAYRTSNSSNIIANNEVVTARPSGSTQ